MRAKGYVFVVIGQTNYDYEGTTTWVTAPAFAHVEAANARSSRLNTLAARYTKDLEKHRQSLPDDDSRAEEWCRLQDAHDRKWSRIWERDTNDPDSPYKDNPSYYVQELELSEERG